MLKYILNSYNKNYLINNIYIFFFKFYIIKNKYIVINANANGNEIVLNAIAFGAEYNYECKYNVDEFNQFSKENDLGIYINLNLLTSSNSTKDYNNYGNLMESLLMKKNKKYDIYFYENVYSWNFGPYLLNLRNWISEDFINIFNPKLISSTCEYNDKLIGLINFFFFI